MHLYMYTYIYTYINQSMIMGHFPHSKTHQELEQLQQMRAEERGGRQECLKNGELLQIPQLMTTLIEKNDGNDGKMMIKH